jgi:hypothetical protein
MNSKPYVTKTIHSGSGYYRLNKQWNHPRHDDKGRVFEHILVYEQFHRCCVLMWGIIHHISGDRQDNRIENLEGMTRAQHNIHHKKLER